MNATEQCFCDGEKRPWTSDTARAELSPTCVDRGGPLVVLGTSGHAREIISIAASAGRYSVVGCVGPRRVDELDHLPEPWLGEDDWLYTAPLDIRYVIGVGTGAVRSRLDRRIVSGGRETVVLVHRSAVVGPRVQLGGGVVVWPGAVLTTDIRVGRHVHVTTNVAVGHDATLEDYATLLPGCTVGGGSRIGEATTIGAGASVIDGITVGARSLIGAGAVVIRDVPDGTVVVGVPARPLTRSAN